MQTSNTIATPLLLTLLLMATGGQAQGCVQSNIIYEAAPCLTNTTLAACQAGCQTNPTCQFYTWNNLTKGCGLYNFPIGGMRDAPNIIAGTTVSSAVLTNTTFVASVKKTLTMDGCSRACQQDAQCQSWTWYTAGVEAQTCFINYQPPEVATNVSGSTVLYSGTRSCIITCSLPAPPPVTTTTTTMAPTTTTPAKNMTAVLLGYLNPVVSWPCKLTIPNVPEVPLGTGAAVLGSKVFYCGTFANTSCYTLDNSTWSSGPRMITARKEFTLTTVGNQIVAAGGYSSSYALLSSVEIFKAGGTAWQLANWTLSAARVGHCAVTLSDTQLLLVGNNNQGDLVNNVEIYNVITGAVTKLPSMTTRSWWHACALWGNRLVVSGGEYGAGTGVNVSRNVFALDLSTKTWSALPNMINPHEAHTMAVINGALTVFGGGIPTASNTVETLAVNATSWVQQAGLPATKYFNAMVMLPCP